MALIGPWAQALALRGHQPPRDKAAPVLAALQMLTGSGRRAEMALAAAGGAGSCPWEREGAGGGGGGEDAVGATARGSCLQRE